MVNKIILLFVLVIACSFNSFTQQDERCKKDSIQFVKTLEQIRNTTKFIIDSVSNFKQNPLNYNKVNHYENLRDKVDSFFLDLDSTKNSKEAERIKTKIESKKESLNENQYLKPFVIYTNFNYLAQILYAYERDENCCHNEISPFSYSTILAMSDLDELQGLLYAISEFNINNTGQDRQIRSNLMHSLSKLMNVTAKNELAWYNYDTSEKQLLKGLMISTANDLFTPMGLGLDNFIPDCAVFQKNNDMDYTGNMKIGLVTDYLKINRNKSIKSYQTLFFGADVFTPYFRDTAIFNHDTSYNIYDRPHASFQYFGIETNAVSRNYRFRWNVALKLGKIGGNKANNLQTALHQDLTSSPRPKGWGAQIANTGRLGFSLEYKHEFLLSKKKYKTFTEKFWEFYPSAITDLSVGTYMTYIGAGFQISNKNYYSSNQNDMTIRTRIGSRRFFSFKHVLFKWDINLKAIMHNSMLQGYGIFNTTESSSDLQTPLSIHCFRKDQIRPFTVSSNFTLSKQTKNMSFFYKFSIKSPELKKIYYPDGSVYIFKDIPQGNKIKIYTRWHHYGTIGVNFKIGQ